jgi:hypothetical protein
MWEISPKVRVYFGVGLGIMWEYWVKYGKSEGSYRVEKPINEGVFLEYEVHVVKVSVK